MRYKFPYGFAGEIEMPDQNLRGIFQAHPFNPLSEEEIIAHAVQKPIAAPPFRNFNKEFQPTILSV